MLDLLSTSTLDLSSAPMLDLSSASTIDLSSTPMLDQSPMTHVSSGPMPERQQIIKPGATPQEQRREIPPSPERAAYCSKNPTGSRHPPPARIASPGMI